MQRTLLRTFLPQKSASMYVILIAAIVIAVGLYTAMNVLSGRKKQKSLLYSTAETGDRRLTELSCSAKVPVLCSVIL